MRLLFAFLLLLSIPAAALADVETSSLLSGPTVYAAQIQADATRDAASIERRGSIYGGALTFLGGLFVVIAAVIGARNSLHVKQIELLHRKNEEGIIADREYVAYLSICHTEACTRSVTTENAATDFQKFADSGRLPPAAFIENTFIKLFTINDNDRRYFGRIPKVAFDKITETTKIRSRYNYEIGKALPAIKTSEDILKKNHGNFTGDDYGLNIHNQCIQIGNDALAKTTPLLKEYATLMADLPPIIETELTRLKTILASKEA